ncbi:helix-turn-helix transcriptional regulator [Tsukamurella hominis]|uniref:helix-turn-helix transcriptional regulator n=1 Tax=Tsukamurella hominis TaxID=1970232 RepID=UPI0039EBA30D
MAKRPLRPPRLPRTSDADARREFFLRAQKLVLDAGDPAVAALAADVGLSHQTVYQALTGPRMPSKRVVDLLKGRLSDDAGDLQGLWTRGVAEERSAPQKVMPAPSVPVERFPPGKLEFVSDKHKFVGGHAKSRLADREREAIIRRARSAKSDVQNPAALSDREREAIATWIVSSSKEEAARQLSISTSTMATYVARVRAKYQAAGRPAGTKSALLLRLLEDGMVDVVEDGKP